MISTSPAPGANQRFSTAPQQWQPQPVAADEQSIVEQLMARLPTPECPQELSRFKAIARCLGNGNGDATAQSLEPILTTAGEAYPQVEAYALVVLAEAEFRRCGLTLNGSDRLLRIVRHQVRAALILSRASVEALSTGEPLWLIPYSAGERTAAHVAALQLTRSMTAARPWMWPGIIPSARFAVVATGTVTAGHSAEVLLGAKYCAGQINLFDLLTHQRSDV